MPHFMTGLTVVGTAAMLWVGGSIIVHALAEMGAHGPEDVIYGAGKTVSGAVELAQGFINWLTKAILDGILGLAIGFALIPVGERMITPLWRWATAKLA